LVGVQARDDLRGHGLGARLDARRALGILPRCGGRRQQQRAPQPPPPGPGPCDHSSLPPPRASIAPASSPTGCTSARPRPIAILFTGITVSRCSPDPARQPPLGLRSLALHAARPRLRRVLDPSLPSPPPGARRRGLATGCVLLALALSACGGRGVHRAEAPPLGETFGAEDTYSREYPVPPAVACEAARRALLGQGYVIGRADDETLEATKVFQPESDLHTQLNLRATCVERADGGSIVFLNAVQDRHVLRTQSSSASVGVSMIGSVSLPVPIGNNA